MSNNSNKDKEEVNILYKEQYKPWFRYVLIIVFPFLPLFWKYHVKITEDELSFGYSSKFTSKRIDRRNNEIIKGEVVPLFDQKWNGWGIHYKPPSTFSFSWNNVFSILGQSWERQYIAKNGGAVKVIIGDSDESAGSNKTTTFYFSSEDPQKICDILNKKLK